VSGCLSLAVLCTRRRFGHGSGSQMASTAFTTRDTDPSPFIIRSPDRLRGQARADDHSSSVIARLDRAIQESQVRTPSVWIPRSPWSSQRTGKPENDGRKLSRGMTKRGAACGGRVASCGRRALGVSRAAVYVILPLRPFEPHGCRVRQSIRPAVSYQTRPFYR
jgi:hypothetical protein